MFNRGKKIVDINDPETNGGAAVPQEQVSQTPQGNVPSNQSGNNGNGKKGKISFKWPWQRLSDNCNDDNQDK